MLGGCSLSYGDRTVDGVNYHTKKPWVLLAYLIAFRSREIPVEELMDLLYPGEGGASPSGARTVQRSTFSGPRTASSNRPRPLDASQTS